MSANARRSASQLQALAAQRRDLELRRADEANRVARYFDTHDRRTQRHESWTTQEYYDRANKECEKLAEEKIKAVKLEERRKKLEKMLFQENLQFQEELKTLSSQPKLYRNGSYLNAVPTSTLQDINLGIRAKEEELRKREAELRLYHAWRANQPAVREAESRVRSGALKTAWMEQIVEKEMQKKKEEEDTKRSLRERDECLKRQIQIEEEKLREKEAQMKELRTGLESQISQLSDAEDAVKELRKREELETFLLEQLRFIAEERSRQHAQLSSERETNLVNLGLHKHRLKLRVLAVQKEIQLDIDMLQRLWESVAKDMEDQKETVEHHRRVLEEARESLNEQRERERQRQKHIESMYDGEARQINEKQDKLWAKERQARASLMEEVMSTLKRQLEERLEQNRREQQQNVLERERILDDVESYHREVQAREREKQFQTSKYGGITSLQSELKGLQLEERRLGEKQAEQAAAKRAIEEEELLRRELIRIQRDGVGDTLPGRRRSELKGIKLEERCLEEKQAEQAAANRAIEEEELLRRELIRVQRDGLGDTLPGRRRVAW